MLLCFSKNVPKIHKYRSVVCVNGYMIFNIEQLLLKRSNDHNRKHIKHSNNGNFMLYCNKMKNKKYHIVRTFPKCNRKILEKEAKSIPLTDDEALTDINSLYKPALLVK